MKVYDLLRSRPIHGELLKLKEEIHQYALDYGLDFYPVIFEMCGYDTIYILAAQGGFPARYPHWRFGMEYDQLSKSYAYGLQKIYEMVINTNPCYAYLLTANNFVDQKIVMAHVYGHADFFKNNAWFRTSDRNMMDVMANHGAKIRRYMETYGQDRVEEFIDKVLSFENLLDINTLFETQEVKRNRNENLRSLKEEISEHVDGRSSALKSFMRSKLQKDKTKKEVTPAQIKDEDIFISEYLESPKDVMAYLINHAPLEEWETDVLGILRDEAYYFLPQRMTKIINEGWASYWHSTIMTKNALKSSEIIDFADKHSGVMAMSKQNINPYKIGIELFRDIEYRWDTGKFGKDYNDCTDMVKKANWNTSAFLGRQKIFEIRRTHNDITFLDEFFTQEFCERMQLFTYKYNPRTGRNEIESREFEEIKSNLLHSLTNFGQPLIEVESGNYKNRGELLLRHIHQGVDLDMAFAADTLKNLYFIWKRPVNIATIQDSNEMTYCFNGKEMKPVQ
ncbi:MAG: SpoVR family protein [Bacteriovoracaceae bacterium]|nr:SpoVR family protein [Bacteriovoracaceae bacterium]